MCLCIDCIFWMYIYMSLDVGFLVAHSVFLIIYHAFKIQSEMTKRCKEAECWTFSGKSTHSSWQIRLLLIIFGTYISMQLNRVYMCPFVWFFIYFFEPWTFRNIDPSDYRPIGPMTLRTNEPSDQCPGIVKFITYLCIRAYITQSNPMINTIPSTCFDR